MMRDSDVDGEGNVQKEGGGSGGGGGGGGLAGGLGGGRAGRRWDVVVLQDQSMVPAVPGSARAYTVPAVEEFVAMARDPSSNLAGATIALYMTHAYLNGGIGFKKAGGATPPTSSASGDDNEDDSGGGSGGGGSGGRGSGGGGSGGDGSGGSGGGGVKKAWCPPRHGKYQACFPLGDIDAMTSPPCDGTTTEATPPNTPTATDWADSVPTFACQGGAAAAVDP